MAYAHAVSVPRERTPWALRAGFWVCVVIAVLVVVRRVAVLVSPSNYPPPPAMAGLDQAFASHAGLTLAHILPAVAFVLLCPFLFSKKFARAAWLDRLLFPLGFMVGVTAYAMSAFAVGGWIERSAVLAFDSLFLYALCRAFGYKLQGDWQMKHRWLTRAVVVLLGIATTRPVMGVFFATSQLTHMTAKDFFGIAFWIGFAINAVAAELWLRSDRYARYMRGLALEVPG